jgi:hypothetical protein
MADTADFAEQREDLLQSIEQDRRDVRTALRDLSGAAGFKIDIAEHIKASPLTWAVGAFLVGVWLGTRGSSVDGAGQRSPK